MELTYLKKNKTPSRTHPKTKGLFDLRCANLRKAKLPGARLERSCLNEAEMFQAFLESANITRSELIEVDLAAAVLRKANLSHSDLKNCNLRGADLAYAILDHSDLTGANLFHANLYRASVEGATFDLARLTDATGLEAVVGNPSSVANAIIDSVTLQKIASTDFGKLLAHAGDVIDVKYQYDVAISFAGEDRPAAEALASAMIRLGIRLFYDEFEKASLWGKNLYDHLSKVYRENARFCVLLISKHYAQKRWPTHERQAAQARAFEESREYILPIRLDETEVKGILPTIAFIQYQDHSAVEIARLLKEKIEGLRGNRRANN